MRNLSKKFCVIFFLIFLYVNGCSSSGETGDEIVVAPMKKTEQEALYSAIQGFVGNWWNGSHLYPDPCGWTPIQGVSCDLIDGFWYVIGLNIGPLLDNSLTCTQNPEFRPQIFELNHLKSLSFFDCFTSHQKMIVLPTDNWQKLAARLESLAFRSNPSLNGQIPSMFGGLQNLQSLVLTENGFTGPLPSKLGNLGSLKRLVISGNKCNGQIPDNLGNLNKLLILDLSRNQLSGHLPSSIGYLKSLLKLDLGNNILEGTIPREIGNLKNLTLLDLRSNKFYGGLPSSLEEMDSLQELIFSSNPIGGDMKNVDWQKLQNLVILDLSNLGLVGQVPKSMAKLKKLRYVGLGNNFLTGNLPSELANMPSVTAIYVNENNLTGELKFTKRFYEELGRRFGAWNNSNLCYPAGLMLSGHAPFGVEQCKSEEIFNDPVLKTEFTNGYVNPQQQQQQGEQPNVDRPAHDGMQGENENQNSDLILSSGLSNKGIDKVWWVFLIETFMMVLVWNCFT